MRCLRGSYLELMLGLEGLEDGVAMTPLVVHVPGHTEDSIAESPLFELYRAGRRHCCALRTVIREAALGRATSEAIDGFLAGDDVTLERADAWLGELENAPQPDGPDLGALGPDALWLWRGHSFESSCTARSSRRDRPRPGGLCEQAKAG